MLLKLFKSNHPLVIFLIPVVGITLWIPALFNVLPNFQVAQTGNTTFAFNALMQVLDFHPKFPVIFALTLLIIESFILIRLNFKYIFIETKTYLPSVLFVLFASTLSSYQMLFPLLLGNLFILLAINRAFLIDKNKNDFKRYYESGFFLGLGSLFYPNIYVFIVLVWLTLIILRTFNWREWFSSIIGLVTPFSFYFAILFLSNKTDDIFVRLLKMLSNQVPLTSFSPYSLVAIAFLLFVIIITTLSSARVVGIKKVSTRKYFTLFFWFMAFVMLLFILHPAMGYELVVSLAIPLSIICSIFFTEIRKQWLGETLFGLMVVSALVIIWFQ